MPQEQEMTTKKTELLWSSSNSRFKIQEVFIVNLYRGIHNMLDMLLSTNTTKGGWNHIWLIYPLFHYSNFPIVLWTFRTLVSKTTDKQSRYIASPHNLLITNLYRKHSTSWHGSMIEKWFVSKCSVRISLKSIALIAVWENELLANLVFREVVHSINCMYFPFEMPLHLILIILIINFFQCRYSTWRLK